MKEGRKSTEPPDDAISNCWWMKVQALACDYDGTLAHDGVLDDATAAALDRFRASGRHLLMVTGRELPDLQKVCHVLDKFEWIVAENGALLYRPSDRFNQLLCEPASAALAQKLAEAQAQPLSIGRAIVATREPHETLVIEAIKTLGLELQVIFNKGAVMVLPTGVNKATGLTCALKEMASMRRTWWRWAMPKTITLFFLSVGLARPSAMPCRC